MKGRGKRRRDESSARPRSASQEQSGGSSGGGVGGTRRQYWGDGRPLAEADYILAEAAPEPASRNRRRRRGRELTSEEAQTVKDHIADAGFDEKLQLPAPRRLIGIHDGEVTLEAGTPRSAARLHFAEHAVKNHEWPEGTTFDEYIESIAQSTRSPQSVMFCTGRFGENQLVYVMRRSGGFAGKREVSWMFIVYDVQKGRWRTGFQRAEGPARMFERLDEKERQWLTGQTDL